MNIVNPILPGFNPDPSICRVGDDYYIATSTFEWFPGIQIHHSKDLVHWRLVTQVLQTRDHLNMVGMDNSEGVYAPTLSYSEGRFYVCFANTHSCRGATWMATPCFMVTSSSIEGPWSLPRRITSTGFDPSIFHDDDGKKYIVNMMWDGRKKENFFGGIFLQGWDDKAGKLMGKPKKIFSGTRLALTEGPQIIKKGSYYYLITAEGGTGYNHGVTVCRSKHIEGPYEVHPNNPMLTSRFQEDAELQRAGHGFLVETQKGEWYMTHLCGRPLINPEEPPYYGNYANGRCILGRESAIQKIEWRDDWPHLASGGTTPQLTTPAPDLPPHPWPTVPIRDDFTGDHLSVHYATLREPMEASWCSLKARPGFLRLVGRHYLYSRYEQSLIARRLQSFCARVETALEFEPENPMQMAGLLAYYARGAHYLLKLSANDEGERYLQVVQFVNDQYDEHQDEIAVGDAERVYLRLELDTHWYQFSYSLDGERWQTIGSRLNSTHLSDEGSDDVFRFTGTMVGMFAADVSGEKKAADFAYFDYEAKSH